MSAVETCENTSAFLLFISQPSARLFALKAISRETKKKNSARRKKKKIIGACIGGAGVGYHVSRLANRD